ncbi:MAG: SDR family NAD(P)-dependent oxidoreductase [Alistipes sp.]
MKAGEVVKGSATAVVTGGSRGIGLCYAERLAALGYNIVIASFHAAANEKTAAELHDKYGITVHTLEIDLARESAAQELFDYTHDEGLVVKVLINNAGTFSFLDTLNTPLERIRRMLFLHVSTTTLTCRLFGEEMAQHGGGYILNMASYSLWMPWPGLALYSASKAYIRSFSIAFSKEMRERQVRVTSVCPAGVATDLYGLPDRWQRIGIRLGILLTPDSCARRALKALWRGHQNCVPGWWNRLFIPLCITMPAFLLRIARKYTMKFQR